MTYTVTWKEEDCPLTFRAEADMSACLALFNNLKHSFRTVFVEVRGLPGYYYERGTTILL